MASDNVYSARFFGVQQNGHQKRQTHEHGGKVDGSVLGHAEIKFCQTQRDYHKESHLSHVQRKDA